MEKILLFLAMTGVLLTSCDKQDKYRRKISGTYEITDYHRQSLDHNGNIIEDTVATDIGLIKFTDLDAGLHAGNSGAYKIHFNTFAFGQISGANNTPLEGTFEWGNWYEDDRVILEKWDEGALEYIDLIFTIKHLKKKKMKFIHVQPVFQNNNEYIYHTEEFDLKQVDK
ncbi:MAG: hypothetical protein H6598_02980 [Flavobacteriales bacterium]|nr:hypothetical protein [Flavobacteriales bacterium]